MQISGFGMLGNLAAVQSWVKKKKNVLNQQKIPPEFWHCFPKIISSVHAQGVQIFVCVCARVWAWVIFMRGFSPLIMPGTLNPAVLQTCVLWSHGRSSQWPRSRLTARIKNQACATVTKGCEAVTQLGSCNVRGWARGRCYEEKKKEKENNNLVLHGLQKKPEQLPVFPPHDSNMVRADLFWLAIGWRNPQGSQ